MRRTTAGAGARWAIGLPALILFLGGCTAGETTVQQKPPERQIDEAVLAAPEPMRAGAGVLGYGASGELTTLREGSNSLLCLADDPEEEGFRVACYHRDLEPFMARGRELRANGVTGDSVDAVRFSEIRAGELPMPEHPAALYNLGADAAPEDPASGEVPGAQRLFVLYVSGATAEEVGLPASPVEGMEGVPWLMLPGTPKAHVMFTPQG